MDLLKLIYVHENLCLASLVSQTIPVLLVRVCAYQVRVRFANGCRLTMQSKINEELSEEKVTSFSNKLSGI